MTNVCLFLKYYGTFPLYKSISQPTLTVVFGKNCCFTSLMMQLKEKVIDAVASSLYFGNFPGNFIFVFETQVA